MCLGVILFLINFFKGNEYFIVRNGKFLFILIFGWNFFKRLYFVVVIELVKF